MNQAYDASKTPHAIGQNATPIMSPATEQVKMCSLVSQVPIHTLFKSTNKVADSSALNAEESTKSQCCGFF